MQGKVAVAVNVLAVPRITLAYARKRQTPMYADRIAKGHPRLRGEKRQRRSRIKSPSGSPPLTRGKVAALANHPNAPGITPAYAGKSFRGVGNIVCRQDHPRLRGEKILLKTPYICVPGSPPLTRGKGKRRCAAYAAHGITPAYAGKRLKQVANKPDFRQNHHLSISFRYTISVNLQSAVTRCIPSVSSDRCSAIVSSL